MDDSIPLPVTIPPGRLTAALRKQIEREVEAVVPEGKRFAVVGIFNDDKVLTAGVAMRLGKQRRWHLDAGTSIDFDDKDITGQARIIGSW